MLENYETFGPNALNRPHRLEKDRNFCNQGAGVPKR